MVIRRERGKMQADPEGMTTRPSAGARLFYEDDPDWLRTQVVNLLTDVMASTKVMPKALIAPHAGYVYSGRVAAGADDHAGRADRATTLPPCAWDCRPLRSVLSKLPLAAWPWTWRP